MDVNKKPNILKERLKRIKKRRNSKWNFCFKRIESRKKKEKKKKCNVLLEGNLYI